MTKSNVIKIEDLKDDDKFSEIIVEINNNGISYTILRDGEEVGVIGPPESKKSNLAVVAESKPQTEAEKAAIMKGIEELAKEISENWQGPDSAVETLIKMRR